MLNQVILIGTLQKVTEIDEAYFVTLEGDDGIKFDIIIWENVATVAQDKVGSIMAIKGHLNYGMEIVAERVSFMEVAND